MTLGLLMRKECYISTLTLKFQDSEWRKGKKYGKELVPITFSEVLLRKV
jgi:hypothetical protein